MSLFYIRKLGKPWLTMRATKKAPQIFLFCGAFKKVTKRKVRRRFKGKVVCPHGAFKNYGRLRQAAGCNKRQAIKSCQRRLCQRYMGVRCGSAGLGSVPVESASGISEAVASAAVWD